METLREILMNSADDDIQTLIDYQKNPERFASLQDKYSRVNAVIDEIRRNGGNTFVNLIRSKGAEYDEIVRDVAKQLKIKLSSESLVKTDELEMEIVKKLIADEFSKMQPAQRREVLTSIGTVNTDNIVASPALLVGLLAANLSGFTVYRLSVLAANAIAKAVLNRGLTMGANTALTRSIGVALGPVGWAVGAAWLAVDLAGPAFRKTIPSVIHIAMLRQQYRLSKLEKRCPNPECGIPITVGMKFCGECGTRLIP